MPVPVRLSVAHGKEEPMFLQGDMEKNSFGGSGRSDNRRTVSGTSGFRAVHGDFRAAFGSGSFFVPDLG